MGVWLSGWFKGQQIDPAVSGKHQGDTGKSSTDGRPLLTFLEHRSAPRSAVCSPARRLARAWPVPPGRLDLTPLALRIWGPNTGPCTNQIVLVLPAWLEWVS